MNNKTLILMLYISQYNNLVLQYVYTFNKKFLFVVPINILMCIKIYFF